MNATNWARLFAIACELKPAYDAQEAAFNALLYGTENTNVCEDRWYAASLAYNEQVMGYAAELGELTGNSSDNTRMVLRGTSALPGGLCVAPDYLRQVANYGSFNDKLWSKSSGFYREPTRHFEFPTEGAA
jgi:hypothetical protein